MIDDPFPSDWKELQNGVCRLLNEVGLTAQSEVSLTTPRGVVKVDVYAIDERSVDRIAYIIECKNWDSSIPQSVVHSFTTVMHETGANIGFIVSKHGLQSGAEKYTQHTNVIGLSYELLQERYLPLWWKKIFCVELNSAVDALFQYVEPINSRRERFLVNLPKSSYRVFKDLQIKHTGIGMLYAFVSAHHIFPKFSIEVPLSLDDFKSRVRQALGDDFAYESQHYRPLLREMTDHVKLITLEFHAIFGMNIFDELSSSFQNTAFEDP